ncbi:hypothetical protein [Mycetocola saprophilus]|uniref:hypothetical protein n=1 Tax=Mycetocola saprophilus TaxID=76636 RepID=UPI003BF12573
MTGQLEQHQAAIEERVRGGEGLAGRVFDAARLDSKGGLVRDNYVIVTVARGSLGDERLTAPQRADSDADYYIDIRTVATTAAAARMLLDRTEQQLLNGPLAVQGRACTSVVCGVTRPIATDMTVTPPLFYVDADYSFTSRRT